MGEMIKNVPHSTVLALADQVAYLPGQVVSKTLAQNDAHSLTLFAFDQGEEISTHASGGDALVLVLEGAGKFTIDGQAHILGALEAIVMPAGVPHAVYAQEKFKMMLTVIFPEG